MAAQAITSKENPVAPTLRLTRNPYEAAEILGIGHNQVRQMVRAGELPTLPGRNVNIPLIAIEKYLERLAGGER
jgi:excisionase family DNA binding protein